MSLQYQFARGDLVYAVYSEGFRAGGFNSGGAVPLAPPREIYRPDRLRNYEIGLKLQAFDQRLTVNSAVFFDEWTDIQTDQYRPSGIPFTTNAGDATIRGVETEMMFRSGGLYAELNARYTETRTYNPNPNFLTLLINGLPNAPPFSGGGLVSYEHPVRGSWRMRFAGETTYVGRSRVTFDTQFPEMGGYVRSKLLVELRRRDLGAQLFITNPVNAFDDTFAFGNPFNPSLTPQITPQRPRTFGLTSSPTTENVRLVTFSRGRPRDVRTRRRLRSVPATFWRRRADAKGDAARVPSPKTRAASAPPSAGDLAVSPSRCYSDAVGRGRPGPRTALVASFQSWRETPPRFESSHLGRGLLSFKIAVPDAQCLCSARPHMRCAPSSIHMIWTPGLQVRVRWPSVQVSTTGPPANGREDSVCGP